MTDNNDDARLQWRGIYFGRLYLKMLVIRKLRKMDRFRGKLVHGQTLANKTKPGPSFQL